jgi:8-oxo-dGTP pyrophosphatase MutT (NUDIX family)
VLAKLRVRGDDYALVHAHPKWGDWSLVGGHVEPTDQTWHAAAAREVEEEMAPLRCDRDVVVERLDLAASQWGPVPSRSASMRPTNYRAEWYVLRFITDPLKSLAKLPLNEFRLVRLSDIDRVSNLSAVVEKAGTLFPDGWASLPLSWPHNLDHVPVEHLPAPVATGENA